MATHSSTLAWKIPWTEAPGGLQSMGSYRVRHDWSNLAAAAAAWLSEKRGLDFFLLYTVQGWYMIVSQKVSIELNSCPKFSHILWNFLECYHVANRYITFLWAKYKFQMITKTPVQKSNAVFPLLGFPGGSVVKNLPTMWETQVQSLGWKDPLEKEMAIHSNILA